MATGALLLIPLLLAQPAPAAGERAIPGEHPPETAPAPAPEERSVMQPPGAEAAPPAGSTPDGGFSDGGSPLLCWVGDGLGNGLA